MIEDHADRIGHLGLQLHPPQFSPGQHVEQPSDRAYARDPRPHGGPAAALQQRVADDFDVVAAPDDVRDPADAYRMVLSSPSFAIASAASKGGNSDRFSTKMPGA